MQIDSRLFTITRVISQLTRLNKEHSVLDELITSACFLDTTYKQLVRNCHDEGVTMEAIKSMVNSCNDHDLENEVSSDDNQR